MSKIRSRVLVSGRVQGVFFREGTRKMAIDRGVSGWVRNLPDGRVEAVFEGAPEAVSSAIRWTRRGPERALVTEIHVVDEPPEGFSTFEIRH